MRNLRIQSGMYTQAPDENYEELLRHKWYGYYLWNGRIQIMARINGKYISIHRHIMGLKKGDGLEVHHRDHNPFNNTRENLMVVNHQQNLQLRGRARNNKSGFLAVHNVKIEHLKKQHVALIQVNKQPYYIGRYATAEEAARAYDACAHHFWGELATFNFPDETPTQPYPCIGRKPRKRRSSISVNTVG